jgi:hypothetical protein
MKNMVYLHNGKIMAAQVPFWPEQQIKKVGFVIKDDLEGPFEFEIEKLAIIHSHRVYSKSLRYDIH